MAYRPSTASMTHTMRLCTFVSGCIFVLLVWSLGISQSHAQSTRPTTQHSKSSLGTTVHSSRARKQQTNRPSKSIFRTHTTPITCGLSPDEKKAKRKLFLAARLSNLQGITRSVQWASNHPLLQKVKWDGIQRSLRFLQGRMIRLLGIQWQKGLWLSVYDRGPQTQNQKRPFTWLSTENKRIDWLRVSQLIRRFEITAELHVKRSFWLGVALRQLLALTTRPHAADIINGYKVYWLRLTRGPSLVVVVTSSRIYLRIIWQTFDLHDSTQRQNLWNTDVRSVLDVHQNLSFTKIQLRINDSFPQQTQGIVYMRPQVLCHGLQVEHVVPSQASLRPLAELEGWSWGLFVSNTELQFNERIWRSAQAPAYPQASKPRALKQWLPLSTRWVSTLTGRRWPLAAIHQTLAQLPATRPNHTGFFTQHLKRQVARILRAKGLAPTGSWLWSDTLETLWVNQLMYSSTMAWSEVPSITQGKRFERGLFALGTVSPWSRRILQDAVESIPGIQKIEIYGQPTLYLFTQPNQTVLAFAWQGKRWFTSNHPALLRRLLASKKPPKGHFQTYLPTASLTHLQGWDPNWNIIHIQPARLRCNLLPRLKEKFALQMARYIQHIEVAALHKKRHRRSTVRLAWANGGAILTQKAFRVSCWEGSPWWNQHSQNVWAIPVSSPWVRILAPLVNTQLLEAIQTRIQGSKEGVQK